MVFCFLAAEVTMEICHALKFHYNSEERTAERSKDKVRCVFFFFPKQRFDLPSKHIFFETPQYSTRQCEIKRLSLANGLAHSSCVCETTVGLIYKEHQYINKKTSHFKD